MKLTPADVQSLKDPNKFANFTYSNEDELLDGISDEATAGGTNYEEDAKMGDDGDGF